MKNIFKFVALLAVSSVALSGCIKETFPESSTATKTQISASASALQSAVNGIPAQLVQGYLVYGEQVHETDMALPQLMIGFTELLGDMFPCAAETGYDWYRNYNTSVSFGEKTYFAYLPWFTCYQFIKSANDVIAAVDLKDEKLSDEMKGYAGIAYTCRAFYYYLLTVMYEPVENIYTDCSKVLGLTVPKIDEKTDGEKAKNNPRLTHEEMMKFIYSDLETAEGLFANFTPATGLFPSLAVAYGVHAKACMWDENYADAAKYARLAIDTFGGNPMSKDQLTDLKTGFNTATQAWMWYGHYDAENMGNLCNFTGWMSSEADWGYSSLTNPCIDKSLYDKMSATDYRKTQFLDPDKSNYESVRDDDWIEKKPAYLAFKFRCCNGNYKTYSIGAACDVPFMRVEEMYLIEAEATGVSKGLAAGIELLNNFMKEWRDPEYNCAAATLRDFQLEVLTQERIEFWGEGWGFPNAKRLKCGVMQNYEGTNAPANIFKINCEGIKPNWNFVITYKETDANVALKDKNNPDPSNIVKGPSPIGQYAPGTVTPKN